MSVLLNAVATNTKADSPAVNVIINVLNVAEHVPVLYAFKGFVEDNATVETTIGGVQFASRGDSPVNGFILEGVEKENFTIDIKRVYKIEISSVSPFTKRLVKNLTISLALS